MFADDVNQKEVTIGMEHGCICEAKWVLCGAGMLT